MTARPLVTFFVMAYNQERYVCEAVKGAFSQTYEPLEILLSDDCSTDGTFRIMEEMAAAYDGPHTVVLNRNPENLGLVAHVDRLVEMSSGDLIVAGAGDDISEPERVEHLARVWLTSKRTAMLLHSAVMKIGDAGQELGLRAPAAEIIADPSPLTIVRTGQNCIGATAAWNRALFDRFGPLPEFAEIEDGPMFFRAALLDSVHYVSAPLVRYRFGGLSQTASLPSGREFLYGALAKSKRWRHANTRCFFQDMAKAGHFRDHDETMRVCRAVLEELDLEVALPDRGLAGRLALLPIALRLSIARRRMYFLIHTLKYILERPYSAYYDRRHAIERPVQGNSK